MVWIIGHPSRALLWATELPYAGRWEVLTGTVQWMRRISLMPVLLLQSWDLGLRSNCYIEADRSLTSHWIDTANDNYAIALTSRTYRFIRDSLAVVLVREIRLLPRLFTMLLHMPVADRAVSSGCTTLLIITFMARRKLFDQPFSVVVCNLRVGRYQNGQWSRNRLLRSRHKNRYSSIPHYTQKSDWRGLVSSTAVQGYRV